MKKFFNSLKTAAIALGCLFTTQLSAQLNVSDGHSATDLANQIVGSGVTVSNAQINCAPGGYGIFNNGNTTNIGLNNGVLLTTGSIFEVPGNASGNDASTDVSSTFHGDADLAALSGWSVQDACVLSFDFVSTSNQISVQYVFSSEEYNEYVCSQFNDIFGFFVSGPNPLGGNYVAQNVALVPSSSLPVAINTINNGTSGSNGSPSNCLSLGNAAYFVNNSVGTTIEYDGFTVTLTAIVDIVPGETYNFKFAIADVSDGVLDSGVFIKGSSFSVFLCQAGTLNFVSPNNGLICSNDDIADAISVSTTSIADGDTYVYLLTSTTGEILALNSTGNFDLSAYSNGLYNVYGLSYSGVISEPTVGGNISDIDASSDEGCFELTSPLEFAKIECTEEPSLICPESVSIQCLSDVPAGDASAVAVFPSQCEVNSSVTYNDIIEGNNCSGVVVRTYSVTDDCGNVGSCVQNIYYVDTEAPFLVSATENVTIECGQEDQIPSIEAGDYCDDNVEITFVDENVVLDGCNSSFERHYTFVDNCGNAGQFIQYVSVGDNTSPVINGVEEFVHVQCIDDVPAAAEAFATDNCDENVEVMSFGYDSGNKTSECVLSTAFGPGADWAFWAPTLFTEGYTSSNNFVFDANGGHFDQFADGKAHLYGTVVNTVNPNEKLEINMWFENAADWATWSSMGRNYKDDVNCATPGQLFQDWTYYEMVNDLSVAVGDGDLDGLLLQFKHMPANYYFGFQIGQGANNKNCGNGLSGWFEYTGFYNCEPIEGHGDVNVDINCQPTEEQDLCNTDYTYVYSAVDASGNYNHFVQTIHIEDTIAPEFAFCPENYSVQCTSEVQAAPSLTATDNCSENVVVVALDEIISGNYPCDYVITRAWYAEDECGNRSYCTQEIAVKDETAPIFTFVPENITVECSDEVPAINGQATDNCGDATVTYTDAFEGTSCYGVITRTFEAVDACGNTTYATQYITIVDTTAPVFDAYSMQIYVECDQIESLELLTATDNCNDVTVTYTELHNSGGCLGVLERTYTATDACGNSTTTVQYITITDTTAPTINTPADVTVECDNVPAFELPSAYDNCGEEVVVTGTEEILPGDCENSYTIVRHWVATDLCENVAESTTTITVIDTTNPEWEYVPADINISC
ncbi:MAG: choice-of-anchor L domain-containing protein, partial [Flavobacteriales bacterium]